MSEIDEARRILRGTFGFAGFREGQEAIIRRLLEGRSALAVFPTGGGKSLCYQIPALRLDGLTIVVSPLIALMKDQVDALLARGVPASRLDSSLDTAGNREVYEALRGGRLKLLYVAPERLASERFLHTITGLRIALLAVDEAHCISQWGHNFRPEYLKLARLAARLDAGRVLALTATATPRVASDVAAAFGIADEDVVVASFHRPNLELRASPCRGGERLGLLLARIRGRPPGPAIVYVTLQKTAEDLAASLAAEGLDAMAYHAGLKDEERGRVQEAFMASERAIVVATIAFGMGIDKADIRSVYHYNLPKGLESYAQEIGRAGRDGRPSHCELFASAEDVVTLENFAYGDTPTAEAVASLVADVLGRGPEFDLSIYDLSNAHDIRQAVVRTLLTYLELDGLLEATGASYAVYKFQLREPVVAIRRGLGPDRGDLAARIIEQARKGTVWYTLDVAEAADRLVVPKGRLVSVLADMELRGLAALQPEGVRQGYRRLPAGPRTDQLLADLVGRFSDREALEIDRVHRVLAFALGEGCLTRALLSYFGEEMGADCGHCDRCAGIVPESPAPPPERSLGPAEAALLAALRAQRHKSLASPRQEARFLCGLTSPATTRARLTRDDRFGTLDDVSFPRVLSFVSRPRP